MADMSDLDASVRRLAELLSCGAITLADFDSRRKALLQQHLPKPKAPALRRPFPSTQPPSYRQAAALPPSHSYPTSAPSFPLRALPSPYRPVVPQRAPPPALYPAASSRYAAAPPPALVPRRPVTPYAQQAPPLPMAVPRVPPPYRQPAPLPQFASPRPLAPRPPLRDLRPAPGKMLAPAPRLAAPHNPYARAPPSAPPQLPARKPPGARTVVVRPIPVGIQEEELHHCMSTFGTIKTIVVQREDGVPSCAIVTYVEVEAAQQAVAAQFVSLDAVVCFVQRDVGRSIAHLPKPSNALLLSNLPAEVSVQELHETLAQYPGFLSLRPPNPPTHGTPGYAIAHFSSADDATYAKQSLIGLVLGSHLVETRFARVDARGAVLPDLL